LGWTTWRGLLTIKPVVHSFGNLPEVIDSVCLAQLAHEKSPTQTTGILRSGDTGKSLILNGLLKMADWLIQQRPEPEVMDAATTVRPFLSAVTEKTMRLDG
jgi:hypothetical protein